MNWFRRKPKELPATVDAVPAEIIRLKAEFTRSGGGPHFRTRAFANEKTAERAQWLEARVNSDGTWRLRRMTRFKSNEQAYCQQEEPDDKKALGFFEAVAELADFEIGQAQAGFDVNGEKDDFPAEIYLRTYAEKEGIVFDIDGRPYPTAADGTVPGNWIFPEGAVEKAKQAHDTKKRTVPSLSEKAFPSVTIPTRTLSVASLKAGDEFFVGLYRLRDLVQEAADRGWHTAVPKPDKENKLITYSCHISAHIDAVRKSLKDFSGDVMKANPDSAGEFTGELERAMNALEFNVYLSRGAEELHFQGQRIETGCGDWHFKPETLASRLKGTRTRLATLMAALTGGPINDDSVVITKLLEDYSIGRPPVEVNEIVKWFESVRSGYSKPETKALPGAVPKQIGPPATGPRTSQL